MFCLSRKLIYFNNVGINYINSIFILRNIKEKDVAKRRSISIRDKVEYYADKSIPYALIVLLIIIIGDFFYSEQLAPYATYIHILDGIIIMLFVVDLYFKYKRARNIPEFLKRHWLEIIAIIPFYPILRLVEELLLIARISETVSEGQRVLHEGVEISRLAREAELAKETRLSRIFRPVQRIPRLFESSKFFDEPDK